MALIKANMAGSAAHEAIVLDLGDLRRQAEQLCAAAQAEGDRIVAEARDEAERQAVEIRRRAEEEGRAAGYAEGLEAGQREGHAAALAQAAEGLEKLAGAWIAAARQWDADRRQMVLDARQSLLTLAIELARKIVRRVPEVDASIVIDQVAEALEHVIRPGDVTIRIHPDDRALLEEAMPRLVAQMSSVRHAELREDAAIERGGCIVSAGHGRIDATLDRQLQRLVDALLPTRDETSPVSDETDGGREMQEPPTT